MSAAVSLAPGHELLATSAATAAIGVMTAGLSAAGATPQLRAFRANFPESDIAALRRRIVATRWPDRETVSDRSQGVRLAKVQELLHYWGTEYDWRDAEAR